MDFCYEYYDGLNDQEDNNSEIHLFGIQKGVEEVGPDEELVGG